MRRTLQFRLSRSPAREAEPIPGQDASRKEKQRRFEILRSHWDVVDDGVDLDAK